MLPLPVLLSDCLLSCLLPVTKWVQNAATTRGFAEGHAADVPSAAGAAPTAAASGEEAPKAAALTEEEVRKRLSRADSCPGQAGRGSECVHMCVCVCERERDKDKDMDMRDGDEHRCTPHTETHTRRRTQLRADSLTHGYAETHWNMDSQTRSDTDTIT